MSMLRRLLGTGVLATAMMLPAAMGQHSGHPGNGSLAHRVSRRAFGGGVGGGGIGIGGGVGGWGYGGWEDGGWGFASWLPCYAMGAPSGVFTFVPPMLPMGPGGFVPMTAPQPLAVDRGPIAPPPPAGLVDPAQGNRPLNKAGEKPKSKDSTRAGQFVLMGDRLFRGNNIKKAEERYVQATRLDPSSAAPLIGLAQIALVRVQYGEAARRLREAETAQPGWIVTAPDIQSIYGEPGDFARHLARLESHLQVHPDDRDAWLVLGAEWYLSGRTARGRRLPSAQRSQAQAGYRSFGLSPRHQSAVTATPQPHPATGEFDQIKRQSGGH